MTLLSVEKLRAGYGRGDVLHDVAFNVDEGAIAVILGANGAGKSTIMRALTGMVASAGDILFGGRQVVGLRTEDIVRLGIAHVPQGRGVFAELTVEQNLRVGAYVRGRGPSVEDDLRRWYDVFPRLGERRSQPAGSLSGGEQQMVAVARALMMRPRLLLLDEPSLGLAPLITQELFGRLKEINREMRTTMLIVEQNAQLALDLADKGYVLETGAVVHAGAAAELRRDDRIRAAYLGY